MDARLEKECSDVLATPWTTVPHRIECVRNGVVENQPGHDERHQEGEIQLSCETVSVTLSQTKSHTRWKKMSELEDKCANKTTTTARAHTTSGHVPQTQGEGSYGHFGPHPLWRALVSPVSAACVSLPRGVGTPARLAHTAECRHYGALSQHVKRHATTFRL